MANSRMIRNKDAEIAKLTQETTLLKASVATQSPAENTGAPSTEQAELTKLLLSQLKRTAEETEKSDATKKERLIGRMKSMAEEADKANARIFAQQKYCTHHNQHNKPRTGGQWTSDGHYYILCMECFKSFSSLPGKEPCPPALWPEEMGGAVMEAVNRIGQLEEATA